MLDITFFARTPDDASVDVVGEAYRQELVRRAMPPGPQDLPPGLPPPPQGYYKAVVAPEPANQYDPNAIRVALWAGKAWAHCGYLSRENAMDYQPLFRHLASTSGGTIPAIACDAALVSERGATGVVLHLGSPGECIAELVTDGVTSKAHDWVGRFLAFTGERATTILGVALDRRGQVMLARWAGCEVLPRLTKKADVLVVADPSYSTSNLQKAREYGTPIVPEPEFLGAIGVPPELVARASTRWARG